MNRAEMRRATILDLTQERAKINEELRAEVEKPEDERDQEVVNRLLDQRLFLDRLFDEKAGL